jgi:hypothetical protein
LTTTGSFAPGAGIAQLVLSANAWLKAGPIVKTSTQELPHQLWCCFSAMLSNPGTEQPLGRGVGEWN